MDFLLQWFVDGGISLLALAGFVTYYNQLLTSASPQRQTRLDLMILLVAAVLQVAQTLDPLRYMAYANLQLLILVFPLLGSNIRGRHFWRRLLMLVVVSALDHPGLPWWGYLLGIAGQVGLVWMMQRWHDYLRDHFGPHLLAMALMVAGYWLPSGMHSLPERLGMIAMFMVLSSLNFWYWAVLRRHDRQYSRLAKQVDFDPLTNAASFTLFRTDAQRQFAQAKQAKMPLSVLILDIDYFKRINDHYGHPVGDAVLVAALTRLEAVLASLPARIYRTGGEEFTVLMTLDEAGAVSVAKQMRQAIREAPLAVADLRISVTLSMGMDSLAASDETFDALIARVDADLYLSKARGRDTLTVAKQTLWRHDRLTVSHFYAEYAQPVVDLATRKPVGVAIEARYWRERLHQWDRAGREAILSAELLDFLVQAASKLEVRELVMTVTPTQFADARLVNQVQTLPSGLHLSLALLRDPGDHVWQRWAPRYKAVGVRLLAPRNDADAVVCRPAAAPHGLRPTLVYPIDTPEDLDQAQALGATQGWGDLFTTAVLPQVAARTNRDQLTVAD